MSAQWATPRQGRRSGQLHRPAVAPRVGATHGSNVSTVQSGENPVGALQPTPDGAQSQRVGAGAFEGAQYVRMPAVRPQAARHVAANDGGGAEGPYHSLGRMSAADVVQIESTGAPAERLPGYLSPQESAAQGRGLAPAAAPFALPLPGLDRGAIPLCYETMSGMLPVPQTPAPRYAPLPMCRRHRGCHFPASAPSAPCMDWPRAGPHR